MIQTSCTHCGKSGASEETSFYVVDLPCSDAGQTVESRLLDYYENDMENHSLAKYVRLFLLQRPGTKLSIQTVFDYHFNQSINQTIRHNRYLLSSLVQHAT